MPAQAPAWAWVLACTATCFCWAPRTACITPRAVAVRARPASRTIRMVAMPRWRVGEGVRVILGMTNYSAMLDRQMR
ncbi:hypothetical protein D3C85_1735510 [compost metagenome]